MSSNRCDTFEECKDNSISVIDYRIDSDSCMLVEEVTCLTCGRCWKEVWKPSHDEDLETGEILATYD